ncbi:tRNA1(Val) (adenine(37)-N6)-methyltransferase [Alteribacter natronophilus]|uniref:tRNA1(Val) (adenine(37)-N6)-methyltransferase n=1 Tax=Alteribacter natronophilus TaxID=2583810 RepID=UPI00110DEB46|nr:tRNA1(Val) (adenine(37)-N6)-methyltransferase [Alteribacter natronophilus]TMW69972.1 tRNA1(Val) (adenine(37)-N6)-methyltransferase [Alteribacter natronophilus]
MNENSAEERVDHLPGTTMPIVQRKDVFVFSTDAVLLATFSGIPKKKGKMIDLCAGNGAVPLMLSLRTKAPIDAVEIQQPLAELAERNVKNNNLGGQISIIHKDINELDKEVSWGRYDTVTCNPPYFPLSQNERDLNENKRINMAKHELACTFDDVARTASRLVKDRGRFALVHRPERLGDILITLRKYNLEPKRMQFVHPKEGKNANMVLVESMRRGSPGLTVLPPIIVYGEDGTYTKEFKKLYETW